MKYFALTLFFAIAVYINGCQSDRYYQHQAAELAREYVLTHAPELTPQEVHFIRFNDPIFLSESVLGNRDLVKRHNETTRTEQRQICITWQLPTREEIYMVYGVSTSKMNNWSPVRLLKKRVPKSARATNAAVAVARNYALNYLRDQLPANGYNLIRFTEPKIVPTKFELNFNPHGSLTIEQVKAARMAAEKQLQFSLIWPLDNELAVVLSGVAQSEDLKGWSVNFGGVLKVKDIEYTSRPKEDK